MMEIRCKPKHNPPERLFRQHLNHQTRLVLFSKYVLNQNFTFLSPTLHLSETHKMMYIPLHFEKKKN